MAAVYLDYNATTPLAPEVIEAITGSLRDHWANPSSSYETGKEAKKMIERARDQVANVIGAASEDIIFTSGGTESNNLVFHSVLSDSRTVQPHIITSSIEHDSVLKPLKELKHKGLIELNCVRPVNGCIRVFDIINCITPQTALISIMVANNETGIIQPLKELSEEVIKYNRDNGRIGSRRILLHTDAAQAIGKIDVNIKDLKVDYMTIVGHKFYGPRIGGLYVKGLEEGETPYRHWLMGGAQERGYRPGTENTVMIVGLGMAAQLVSDRLSDYNTHMKSVCHYLERQLLDVFGDMVHFNSHFIKSSCLPNTCNFSLVGSHSLQGPAVLRHLKSCQISLGAACHSNDTFKPSTVLLESGVKEDIAVNALRVSVGRETTTKDIDLFINELQHAVNQLLS